MSGNVTEELQQGKERMIKGECFCGAVQYQIDGPLANARSCHCSRCRKAFSGAASAFAEIGSNSQFTWTQGEALLRQYGTEQGWGLGFCSICGSTLCGFYQGKVMGITLGTVNGDPGVEIEKHIFVESRARWDHIGGNARQFDEWGD
jgi:hypothetical protein